MKMLLTNLIDIATLEEPSISLLPELPLDNVKKVSKARVARTNTSTSTLVITGSLAFESDISAFIIGQHNFAANTTYNLELYNSPDLSGSPISYVGEGTKSISIEEAAIDIAKVQYNKAIWINDTNGNSIESVGSFRLTLTKSSMDYFQIGRLFIGDAIELKVGASYGHKIHWKENSKQYRTEAGTLRTDVYNPSKIIEFSLNTIYESERSNIQRSLSYVGKQREFYISLFPEDCSKVKELDYSGIVKMTKIPKYTEFAPDFYNAKYIVEEI